MAVHRLLFSVVLMSVFAPLSAYAFENAASPLTASERPADAVQETAKVLYQESLDLLLFGEIEEAKAQLLAVVERDPSHREAHKKLCALLASTSATRALPHCRAWGRLETHDPARRFATRFISRLTTLKSTLAKRD